MVKCIVDKLQNYNSQARLAVLVILFAARFILLKFIDYKNDLAVSD